MISYSCVLPGKGTKMHIKEMPASCRPQEKLMYAGAGALSDSELLALIIRTGTSEMSAVQLAEEVISYASANIGNLGRADPKELIEISVNFYVTIRVSRRRHADVGKLAITCRFVV